MKAITNLIAQLGSPNQVIIGARTAGAGIAFGSNEDTSIVRTAAGVLSLGSAKIQTSAAPSDSSDLVTKAYADSLAGSSAAYVLKPVRACQSPSSLVNVNIASPGATVDAVSLSAGDRIFLGAQTNAVENGIWVWNGAAVALTRPTDFANAAVITRGIAVWVLEGTNFQRSWMLNVNTADITVGTTAQTWIEDGSPGFFRHTGGVLTLRTEGTLNFGANIFLQASDGLIQNTSGAGRVEFTSSTNSSSSVFRSKLAADTQYRFNVQAGGTLQWGSGGAAAPDTTLQRSATGILSMSSGHKIQQSTVPTAGSDLTNKTYVDAKAGNQALQATVAVSAQSGTTVPVRVTLKDGSGVALTSQRVVDAWLSDLSTGRQSGTFVAPANFYDASNSISGITKGWRAPMVSSSSAKSVICDTDGVFDVGISNASSYDCYLNVRLTDGTIASSSQIHVSGGNYASVVLSDSPVAYFRLDESSGTTMACQVDPTNNNGTYSGSPSLGVSGAVFPGTGVNFATTSKYATIPAVSALHPSSTSFSIELWFKFQAFATGMRMIDFGPNDYTIATNGTNSFLAFSRNNGVGGADSIAWINNAPNDTTTWHHLVATKSSDAAGGGKLYIDGVEVSSYGGQPPITITPNTSATITVAKSQDAASGYFNGMLDEIAIYNTVLSPARILAHYNAR